MVFTGALDAASNVAAATRLAYRVLPLLRERHPGARLAIVGRRPEPRRARTAGRSRGHGRRRGARPAPMALARRCLRVPDGVGDGIKNKLLEALACGAPSVATPLACRGIDAADDVVLVADSDAAIAARLADVLGDAALCDQLGAASRAHVEAHHSWATVAEAHVALYEEVRAARRWWPLERGGRPAPAAAPDRRRAAPRRRVVERRASASAALHADDLGGDRASPGTRRHGASELHRLRLALRRDHLLSGLSVSLMRGVAASLGTGGISSARDLVRWGWRVELAAAAVGGLVVTAPAVAGATPTWTWRPRRGGYRIRDRRLGPRAPS